MEKVKQFFKEYKHIFISGVVVAVILTIIMANTQQLYFIKCKMSGDTDQIITMLQKDIGNKQRQNHWYYQEGIKYLVKKGNLNEDSTAFLEKNFSEFIEDRQKDIIKGYNNNEMVFKNHQEVIGTIIENLKDEDYSTYLKRIEAKDLDSALAEYYGKKENIDIEYIVYIETLTQIAEIYPSKFLFEKFKFSIYDLLVVEALSEEDKLKLLSKLNPENAKAHFLNEIKMKSIDGEVLKEWIETLNKAQIMDTKTYLEFNTLFSEVYNVRKQYKDIEAQEVDLNNKKEAIELQMGDKVKELEAIQKQQEQLTQELKKIDENLKDLDNYAYMALYVEKSLGNDIYEASIPKKKFFGDYGPSSQKYLIKLTSTYFYKEGVYHMDIYLKGTKVGSDGNEYSYYEEVSEESKEHIHELEEQRKQKSASLKELEDKMSLLNEEVTRIKQESHYEENENELKQIDLKKKEFEKRLEEIAIKMQTLLSIKQINISLKEEKLEA